jgi:chromosome partitioning protein
VKGGVAKTTTAVHLAVGWAAKGRRVLLLDLDEQGHSTLWLAGAEARRGPGLAEALLAGELRPEHVREPRPGLHLAPGGPALPHAEFELGKPKRDGANALRRLLEPLRSRVDVAIIDMPPAHGGVFTLAALVAADGVLGVFMPGFLALDGLAALEARAKASEGAGARAKVLGFLALAVDAREGVADASLELLRREAPGRLLKHFVRVSTAQKSLAERQATAWDPGADARGAEDWPRVLAEVGQRLGLK